MNVIGIIREADLLTNVGLTHIFSRSAQISCAHPTIANDTPKVSPVLRTDAYADRDGTSLDIATYIAGLSKDAAFQIVEQLLGEMYQYEGAGCWLTSDAATQLSYLIGSPLKNDDYDSPDWDESDGDLLKPPPFEDFYVLKWPSSVRFSYAGSVRVCLQYSRSVKLLNKDTEIRFAGFAADRPLMQSLSDLFGLDITVERGLPWERNWSEAAATEIMMPPSPIQLETDDPRVGEANMGPSSVFFSRGRLDLEVLALRDAVENVSCRTIICLSDGTLEKRSKDPSAARSLICRKDRLSAVLHAPKGVLYENAPDAKNVVVVRGTDQFPTPVRFADIGVYSNNRSKSGSAPNWSTIPLSKESKISLHRWRDVERAEIATNEYVLIPRRYLLYAPGPRRIGQHRPDVETARLDSLFRIHRPSVVTDDPPETVNFREVSPQDISEDGMVLAASRGLTVGQAKWESLEQQKLRSGDLLFTIKGQVGKVGIFLPEVFDKPEWEPWSASQSLMILRPISSEVKIHPEVMFMYLSARAVRTYWQAIAAGNRSKAISIRDLENLRVPLRTADLQREIREMFGKVVRNARRRSALTAKTQSLREHAWAQFSRDEVQ
ncbi:hypothetical protein [uncultured Sulfitobacter sp.]|uniref:hypothetical protein n=1 Tax=uncultured Sulfitobacter sp. TaxID=191468 RepID=UPI00263923BB|nr:hypothetical protein [uncultured Sulfitobacter sp.]